MQMLKDIFNPKFDSLVNKLDEFIRINETQHDELYEKANRVPVIEEKIKGQQKTIDTLFKWAVGAFVTAFGAILGLLTTIIIFLITKS